MTKSLKYYFLLTISIVSIFTTIFYIYLISDLPKFKTEYMITEIDTDEEKIGIYYHDLNKDGETEEIIFTNSRFNKSVYSFLVQDNNSKTEKQYNFRDLKVISPVIFDYDLDNDNFDDICFVHQNKDTVFFSAISHGYRKIIYNCIPIYINGYQHVGEWDIIFADLFFQSTDPNKTSPYFIINTGFGLYPRTLFRYDLVKQKIISEFSTSSIFTGSLKDVVGNNAEEIILNSYSSSNVKSNTIIHPYPDSTSWFVMLDEDLEVIFDYSLKTSFNSIKPLLTSQITRDNQKYLINLHKYHFKPDTLVLLTKEGKIVNKKPLQTDPSNILKIAQSSYQYMNITVSEDSLKIFPEKYFNYSTNRLVTGKGNIPRIISTDFVHIEILDTLNNILAQYSFDEKFSISEYNAFSFKYSQKLNTEILSINSPNTGTIYLGLKKRSLLEYFIYYLLLLSCINSFLFISIKTVLRARIYFLSNRLSMNENNRYIFLMNDNFKILSLNSMAKSLLKISKESGIKLIDHFEKNTELRTMLIESKQNNAQMDRELDIQFKEGYRKFNCSITPIKIFGTVPIAFQLRMEDFTDLIRRERSRVWFHSMQKIAHEIKTPLSSMLINLRAIEKNATSGKINSELISDDINLTKREISRIKSLTTNLLKFADLKKLNYQKVDLLEIIDRSKLKFESYTKRGIDLQINNYSSKTNILADAYQIEEVLQVLIENAIDAVSGKGSIIIEILECSDRLKLKVSDNGNGIPAEDLKNIFDPYFTTKKEGTGMGLAIANKIIKDHKSELLVESNVGKGTTFSFELNFAEHDE